MHLTMHEAAIGTMGDLRRRSPRIHVDAQVPVRRLGGFPIRVPLRDVSMGGCRIELLEPCAVDEQLIARFPMLQPLGASVRWSDGRATGVQFHASMHEAVLEALIDRLTQRRVP